MEVCTIWLLVVLCFLSTLMIVNTSVNTSRKPTVKITTQSSIFNAALPSSKVVDGCTKQIFDSQKCCSHTQICQQEAWWQVDLEGQIVMEYVKIYYRDEGDEQRERFGGYQIYQSNTSDWRNGYLCHKDTTLTLADLSLTPKIICTGSAQYLTIYSDRRSRGLSWYSNNAILELCEVEVYGCPLGKYGDNNCDSDCDVGCANSLCDPVTGKCAYCADGYFRLGSLCIECPSNCYDNACNVESGVCSACTPGYYGSHCNQTCLFNCKDNRCMQSNGKCEDCENGFFGSSCDVCSDGCTNHVCDKVSGNCSPCTPGYYGGHCNQTCLFNCKDNRCMQINGECEDCEDGFFGSSCDDCSVGCTSPVCDKISGNCSPCLNGFYGMKCDRLCSSSCENNICTQYEGKCTECVAGFYGSQCLKSCGNCQGVSCDKGTGDCTTECTDGWTGNKCDNKVVIITKRDALHAAVGIGIGSGVVILVLVIVIIVLVRRRTMKRGDTTGSSHMPDISLSRTAIELKQNQDNIYDEIATYNKEQTIAQIPHNEANYEQLGRIEVENPHIYETTDVDKET